MHTHLNAEFFQQIMTHLTNKIKLDLIMTYMNVNFLMMEKCNYSEKLNFLQAQTCNAHLCHHLAEGENHFEQHP